MIKNIVIDCDGVLTDGKKYINADGDREMIAFHSRDNEAISRMIEKGYRVIIVTASDFPGIRRRWMRYNVEVYRLKQKELLNEIAEPPFEWSETVGIGDDLIDFPFLQRCGLAFVPADAHILLRELFRVLETPGGNGVMVEIEGTNFEHPDCYHYSYNWAKERLEYDTTD